VGTMKIYVIAKEAFRKKERHDEIQFITKIDGFFSTPRPPLNANVFFYRLKKNHTPYTTKFKVLVLCFLYFYE
jgi:hypothetical protein